MGVCICVCVCACLFVFVCMGACCAVQVLAEGIGTAFDRKGEGLFE